MADTGGSEDDLHYDVMVENALRGVVRQALAQVAEHGLPGEHHFYVTFRTDHPGVVMPDSLKERYPREMTIVLQHQFWDLQVGDDAFQVTLTFNNVSEQLSIPFEAIAAFADPSVRFGLQFDAGEEDDSEGTPPEQASNYQGEAGETGGGPSTSDGTDGDGTDGDGTDGDDSGGDDKVVTLDRFRKKQ